MPIFKAKKLLKKCFPLYHVFLSAKVASKCKYFNLHYDNKIELILKPKKPALRSLLCLLHFLNRYIDIVIVLTKIAT